MIAAYAHGIDQAIVAWLAIVVLILSVWPERRRR